VVKGTLERIARSLARDRELPAAALVRKGVNYAVALASAPVRLRGCTRVGARARTLGTPRIENAGTLEVGDDAVLSSTFSPVELHVGPGARLAIGHGVGINYGTVVSARGEVRIGDRASIGPYCLVSDTDLPGEDGPGGEPRAVEIGAGAWLGARVTVLPGASVGAGSVITAGSIVSSAIPPGVVAGGIPARVLRAVGTLPAAEGGAAAPPLASSSACALPAAHALAPPAELPAARPTFRGLLIADFTVDELADRLRGGEGARLDAEVAPFGQVIPTLLEAPRDGRRDFAVVWTRPEAISPAFARLLAYDEAPLEAVLSDVDAFCDALLHGLARYRLAFVPTWTVPATHRGLGPLDARSGATRALTAMNARLMDRLAAAPDLHVLNAQRWLDVAGRGHSAKGWYLGKAAFHPEVLAEAARDLRAAVEGLTGSARKLVVVDLDDTLWGGVVGDVGWANLRLGGHDATGEALADFQRGLKALTRRGVVLAIASKNDEAVALEAIRRHPEMVLRESDFVARRIDWNDKARNVAALAAELNLGLQSVVFIDDNPFERARVREALPEVLVPEWPEDKLLYPGALASLRCFDAPAPSREDAERTRLYATERQRDASRAEVGSLDAWLASLGMKVRVEPLGPANLGRAAQLLNKTNQLNLSTRRLTAAELVAWAGGEGRTFLTVSVSDRFGDAGLTGLLGLEVRDGVAAVVDFVLSCRVMGRKVEETMVHLAVEAARRAGAREVVAQHLPTPKNRPCLEFWRRCGFEEREGARFAWDAARPYPRPEPIALEGHA
jgi:FkbH-like protein